MQAVFLSAQSPASAEEFLYGARQEFQGEAAALLRALQIESGANPAEQVLSEFQRKGFFLTHVLECPNPVEGEACSAEALIKRLPIVLRRLRASLKPKKVVVISAELAPVLAELKSIHTGAELLLDGQAAFNLTDAQSVARLRSKL